MVFADAPAVQLYVGVVIAALDLILAQYLKPYEDSRVHKEEIL